MVRHCFDAIDIQQVSHLFDLAAAEAVEDARFAHVVLDVADDLFVRLHLGADLVVEVGAIKRGLHHERTLDGEVLLNVLLHLGRGCGRQRDDGDVAPLKIGDGLQRGADLAVFGAEVVAPFRDAMRLIHRHEADLHTADELDELLARKRLRRDVEQLEFAAEGLELDLGVVATRHGRVQKASLDAEGLHLIDLIFHQGDERRDDEGRALEQHRRQLVAEALASPGGHDDKSVAPGQHLAHGLFLSASKAVEAKMGAQGIGQHGRADGDRGGGRRDGCVHADGVPFASGAP